MALTDEQRRAVHDRIVTELLRDPSRTNTEIARWARVGSGRHSDVGRVRLELEQAGRLEPTLSPSRRPRQGRILRAGIPREPAD